MWIIDNETMRGVTKYQESYPNGWGCINTFEGIIWMKYDLFSVLKQSLVRSWYSAWWRDKDRQVIGLVGVSSNMWRLAARVIRQAIDFEIMGLGEAWHLASRVSRQAVYTGFLPGGA